MYQQPDLLKKNPHVLAPSVPNSDIYTMATSTIEDVDRISHLPDQITDHILSFLRTPDVVRLSVLSKEWYHLFTCFPISTEFSYSLFTSGAVDRRLEFATFVFNSLLRRCRNNRSIPNFQFSITKQHFNDSTPPQLQQQLRNLIDRSIGLSAWKGIKVLAIKFCNPGQSFYKLPKFIFSAKELVVLRLVGCILTKTIKLPSLQELYLKYVDIYEQKVIDNLIFTCPFIEKISLIKCDGMRYLKLSGFTKLKKVKVTYKGWGQVKKIEIDVLSLQTFSFSGAWYWNDETLSNLTSCKNLEVLKFKHAKITHSMIQDINSQFPALKVLILNDFHLQKIEISCPQLEKLQLISTRYPGVDAAIINAPRLQSFKHSFISIPSFFSINETRLREVSLEFSLDGFLQSLQKYFKNFNQVNLVTLHITDQPDCDMQKLASNISTPFLLDINHVELKTNLCYKYYSCAELVDDLFWLCHPESFLLESGYGTNYEFIKVLYKKLVGRGRHQNCCSDTKVKCWRHDLKGFKIEHCGKNGYRKVLEYDAFFDSLQTLGSEEKICFVFKW